MEDELYSILTDCGVGGDQQDKIVPRILSLLGENEIVVLVEWLRDNYSIDIPDRVIDEYKRYNG
jgi:hypothetical protein